MFLFFKTYFWSILCSEIELLGSKAIIGVGCILNSGHHVNRYHYLYKLYYNCTSSTAIVQIVLQLYKLYCNCTKCSLNSSSCSQSKLKRSMDQAPGRLLWRSFAHMDLIGNEIMFFIQIICMIRLSNGKWWSILCNLLAEIGFNRSMKKIQCWFYCKLNVKKNTCHYIICAMLE